jgi:hypothetical protein
MNFLTFTTTGYSSPSRILKQAEDFKIFDKIIHKTELDIPTFIEKHATYIAKHKLGYGRYIWKPKIILDTLLEMKESDILFYCDSGIHLNVKGLARFNEYIDILNKSNKSMVSFCCNDTYKPYMYVRNSAIQYYFPQFHDIKGMPYCYAGAILFKKNNESISFLRDWLMLCEQYFLDDTGVIKKNEHPGFRGQDTDNGLFCLIKAKKSIHIDIYPDEVNIYHSSGVQMEHANARTHPNTWDWSSLDSFPIQYRRDRLR